MEAMNLAVGEKNRIDNYGGKKRLVCPFRRQEFCKFIGCIISVITYGKKGHKIWGETQIFVVKKAQDKLHKDVSGKTDLLKVRCDLYCPHSCYDCH